MQATGSGGIDAFRLIVKRTSPLIERRRFSPGQFLNLEMLFQELERRFSVLFPSAASPTNHLAFDAKRIHHPFEALAESRVENGLPTNKIMANYFQGKRQAARRLIVSCLPAHFTLC